jgi:hypothetical protein
VIGEAIRRVPVKRYLQQCAEATRTMKGRPGKKAREKPANKRAMPVRKKW